MLAQINGIFRPDPRVWPQIAFPDINAENCRNRAVKSHRKDKLTTHWSQYSGIQTSIGVHDNAAESPWWLPRQRLPWSRKRRRNHQANLGRHLDYDLGHAADDNLVAMVTQQAIS